MAAGSPGWPCRIHQLPLAGAGRPLQLLCGLSFKQLRHNHRAVRDTISRTDLDLSTSTGHGKIRCSFYGQLRKNGTKPPEPKSFADNSVQVQGASFF